MSKQQHSGVGSYIIGFILCLILTAIPYHLVTNQTYTGSKLLAIIVGFAAVQMLVQIFFFLHLGRGPKPLYNIAFFAGTVGIIAVVVGGSLFIMSHLHYNMSPTEVTQTVAEGEAIYQVNGNKTGACHGTKANHKITITKTSISPLRIDANLCDTLSFINEDSVAREISFGTETSPKTYAGEASIKIKKGKSETITLNQSGVFSYYDHDQPSITGGFTVTQ